MSKREHFAHQNRDDQQTVKLEVYKIDWSHVSLRQHLYTFALPTAHFKNTPAVGLVVLSFLHPFQFHSHLGDAESEGHWDVVFRCSNGVGQWSEMSANAQKCSFPELCVCVYLLNIVKLMRFIISTFHILHAIKVFPPFPTTTVLRGNVLKKLPHYLTKANISLFSIICFDVIICCSFGFIFVSFSLSYLCNFSTLKKQIDMANAKWQKFKTVKRFPI